MNRLKLYFNPFAVYSEKQLIPIGLLGLLIGSGLASFTGGRYDGIIDLHFSNNVNWWMPLADNVIATGCLLIVFWFLGYFINRKTRIVDILSVSLIARLPIYVVALTNINNINLNVNKKLLALVQDPSQNIPINDLIIALLFAFLSLLMIVWFGALLFKGFKTATNGKGRNLIVAAVLGIILAEALSKFIFFYFY